MFGRLQARVADLPGDTRTAQLQQDWRSEQALAPLPLPGPLRRARTASAPDLRWLSCARGKDFWPKSALRTARRNR